MAPAGLVAHDSRCRDGLNGTLGSAIVVKGTITQTSEPKLLIAGDPLYYPDATPDPVSVLNNKPMQCAPVQGWTTELCTVHLPNRSDGEYGRQIASLVNVLPTKPAVLLGGDFNDSYSTPSLLQPLYDRYAECDQQALVPGDPINEVTHYNSPDGAPSAAAPTKLDHMFATAGFSSGDVLTEDADTTGNAATWSTARGGSLHFDGTTAAVAGVKARGALVPTRRSFTISAWARVATGAPSGIVVGERQTVDGASLGYDKPTNSWQFTMAQADSATAALDRASLPVTAPAGAWTHLLGQYDAITGKMSLYLDGGKAVKTATHTSRWAVDGTFSVGADLLDGPTSTHQFPFTGDIDDVRAYAYPLTGTEIGKPLVPTGNTTIPAATNPASPGCDQSGTYGTVGSLTPKLSAQIAHADPATALHAEFSLWENHTGQPNVQVFYLGDAAGVSSAVTGSGTASITTPALRPGTLYGWYVRAVVCHFRTS